MIKAVTKKNTTEASFAEQFCAALSDYANSGGEAALGRAYDLGRSAADAGTSLIEIASLYHKTLLALMKGAKGERQRAELMVACGEFLAEMISPYEMARRGFQDAVASLQRLNETLEEEIKRIAHAVHDEAGQLLVAVHLALADVPLASYRPAQKQLKKVQQLLNQVEEQLRRYSHELRPTILDDLGWVPAIRFLAEAVSKRTGLPIRVEAFADQRLPGSVEIALYRIVQEALNNVTKHANASNVLIEVKRDHRVLKCLIRDDGRGFDVRAAQSNRSKGSLGLIGMEERLAAVGGNLRIESRPGHGTTLAIHVPVR